MRKGHASELDLGHESLLLQSGHSFSMGRCRERAHPATPGPPLSSPKSAHLQEGGIFLHPLIRSNSTFDLVGTISFIETGLYTDRATLNNQPYRTDPPAGDADGDVHCSSRVSHGGPTLAVTPKKAVYTWYGQQIEVDLVKCREALCLKLIDLELRGHKSSLAFFAQSLGLHPETLRKFRVGRPMRPTSLNIILAGLGLTSQDVVKVGSATA